MPNQKMRNFTSTGYFTKVFQVLIFSSNHHPCCEGQKEPRRPARCGCFLELPWSGHLCPQQCGRESTRGNHGLPGEGLRGNLRVNPGNLFLQSFSLAVLGPCLLTCMQNSSANSQAPGCREGLSQRTGVKDIINHIIRLHFILFRAPMDTWWTGSLVEHGLNQG